MPNAKRHVLALFLALLMTVPFAGCSSGEAVESTETVGAESTENTETETETETETAAAETDGASEAESETEKKVDLTGLTIGVQLGTTGDLSGPEEYGDDAVVRYNQGFEAVPALVQGKIDAVVIDDLPAEEFVNSVE